MVFVRTPDGHGQLELIKYHSPADPAGVAPAQANRLGLRHLAFVVEDLLDVVSRLQSKGFGLVGEIQDYQDIYRLCYVRGPEGIIVELAQRLGRSA